MAEYSFPFDAVLAEDGTADRVYYAADWKRMLQHYFTNGIFPNPDTNLQAQSLNNNMVVTIQPGYAHINGGTYTSDEIIEFALDTANANYNRIDLIVVRLDETERIMRTLYIPGEASSNPLPPELVRNSDVWDLKLAEITVRSGTQVISQSDILDTRLDSEVCGIVAAIPEGVDTTTLFNQYKRKWEEISAQMDENEKTYDAWFDAWKKAADADLQERKDAWDNAYEERTESFDAWFAESKTAIYDAKYFDFENWTYRAGETKKTVFNADGSITEKIVNTVTAAEVAVKETVFNSDGSITEHLTVPELEIDATKTTTFNSDGSIDEVIE